MKIEYTKSAIKALNRMEKPLRLRIRDAIEGLTQKPPKGNIAELLKIPSILIISSRR